MAPPVLKVIPSCLVWLSREEKSASNAPICQDIQCATKQWSCLSRVTGKIWWSYWQIRSCDNRTEKETQLKSKLYWRIKEYEKIITKNIILMLQIILMPWCRGNVFFKKNNRSIVMYLTTLWLSIFTKHQADQLVLSEIVVLTFCQSIVMYHFCKLNSRNLYNKESIINSSLDSIKC